MMLFVVAAHTSPCLHDARTSQWVSPFVFFVIGDIKLYAYTIKKHSKGFVIPPVFPSKTSYVLEVFTVCL